MIAVGRFVSLSLILFVSVLVADPLYYTFEGYVESVTDPTGEVLLNDLVTYELSVESEVQVKSKIVDNVTVYQVFSDASLIATTPLMFPTASNFTNDIHQLTYDYDNGISIDFIKESASEYHSLQIFNALPPVDGIFTYGVGSLFFFKEHTTINNSPRSAEGSLIIKRVSFTPPSAAVPEPGSIVLMLTGVVAVGAVGYRQRRFSAGG